MITMITGGIKSGKSAYALKLLDGHGRGVFIATTDPADESMTDRIEAHKREREGLPLYTIEATLDLPEVESQVFADKDVVIIDCITMWLSNLMFKVPESGHQGYISQLLGFLEKAPFSCIVISNEVGLGVIPENRLAREYSSKLGLLNAEIARRADRVYLMISGYPVTVK